MRPKDIIAIITMIGFFVLKLTGLNGGLDAVAALILGYYFAHRVNGTDNGL